MLTYPTAMVPAELAAGRLPRLLPPQPIHDLAAHLDWLGEPPSSGSELIAEVERSGLRGRGGAGFPTAVKMGAVAAARRRTVVVANGTEGEPTSAKDKTLLSRAPHLVIDGAVMSAGAVKAREVVICVERNAALLHRVIEGAIHQRQLLRLDPVVVRLATTPGRYLTGEESALVHWLNGGEAKPTFVPPRPFEKGVGGHPTLVQNVETLAHLALIGRFGADWFRSVGTGPDPGSALVTVSGAVTRPGIQETPLGTPLVSLLATAGASSALQAVLVGGYFGTWLPASALASAVLSPRSLGPAGPGMGCGAIIALPAPVCGLAESARVARWLADQTAGQCGPCVQGLDAIARAMAALVSGDWNGHAQVQLERWLEMVKGRGACKHPDGAARFVESSLLVFADEISRHRRQGPCPASNQPAFLPLPAAGAWR